MSIQQQPFRKIPVARKLLVVVAVFVGIVIGVFCLGVLRSELLSGIRAYVGGEGMWSKAEKRAVLSLTKYADSRAESDFQQYLAEIAVPMGDKQARLQLESPTPNMDLVLQGFVQGRNSPEDVADMVMLFLRFRNVGYMAKAIEIWTEGDGYIDQLRDLAGELHAEVNSSHAMPLRVEQIKAQIVLVDARVTPLEDNFSATLGQGARWINRVLSTATLAASALLLLLGLGLSLIVLKQIHNSEEKYRSLIDAANDAILVIDAESRLILEANNEAGELLGVPEGKLVGMPESELYPNAELGPYRRQLTPEPAKSMRRQQLDLLRRDGTIVPVEVSASITVVSGKRAVLGIFRDITERLEAAAVLRRSEERFGQLIQNLSDVITVIAADSTMVYHSPSLERVTGYRPSDLLGKSLTTLVHPEEDETVRASLLQMTLHPGTAVPMEFRLRSQDGNWIWLESIGTNLLDKDPVGGIVVTSRDVSRRHLLEDQVRQAQKMEAVGRLAGGIAHDFNNLLMVIRGYAEITSQQLVESPGIRQSVDTIVRTTEKAANLTRQLLSFSRKHVFNPQVVSLNTLVSGMTEMIRGLIGEEIIFEVKLAPDSGTIRADAGQIEQVVMNLVVNARDAMGKGGSLRVETSNLSVENPGSHWQPAIPAGKYVLLTVVDTGSGMDAETQSHIFEPFFTTKNRNQGSGLGLSVVYNVISESGGHVRVRSAPGKGTTFEVYFPRLGVKSENLAIATPVEPFLEGTGTILVSEDQADLRWMICQFLQELGYSVLETKDGADAIALAHQYKGRIDVLLTDVVMPGIRGPEVAKSLTISRPGIKVIYMSGYTEGGLDSITSGDQGQSKMLQKPFKLGQLAACIRDALGAIRR